jgi:large subunit ribosomal protein L22
MEATKSGKCILKYLRIGPRKVRIVLDTIRWKNAHEALFILKNMNKKAAGLVLQGLKSAIANAKVLKLDLDRLYVAEVKADTGPLMKRFMARSMGRADRMVRRTTHITVVVRENERAAKAIPEAPLKQEAVALAKKESKVKTEKIVKKKVGAKS